MDLLDSIDQYLENISVKYPIDFFYPEDIQKDPQKFFYTNSLIHLAMSIPYLVSSNDFENFQKSFDISNDIFKKIGGDEKTFIYICLKNILKRYPSQNETTFINFLTNKLSDEDIFNVEKDNSKSNIFNLILRYHRIDITLDLLSKRYDKKYLVDKTSELYDYRVGLYEKNRYSPNLLISNEKHYTSKTEIFLDILFHVYHNFEKPKKEFLFWDSLIQEIGFPTAEEQDFILKLASTKSNSLTIFKDLLINKKFKFNLIDGEDLYLFFYNFNNSSDEFYAKILKKEKKNLLSNAKRDNIILLEEFFNKNFRDFFHNSTINSFIEQLIYFQKSLNSISDILKIEQYNLSEQEKYIKNYFNKKFNKKNFNSEVEEKIFLQASLKLEYFFKNSNNPEYDNINKKRL